MISCAILIPARYGSTRFEGKPLTSLDGKTMIARVAETCCTTGIDTYVLTDNKTVAQVAKASGAGAYIDSKDYNNGTERCAGAIKSNLFDKYSYFINVQGDMPDVTPDIIFAVRDLLVQGAEVATAYTDMDEIERLNLNVVKMIKGTDNAQWFGRGFAQYGYHHLGIYGYTREALQFYPALKVFEEEEIEKLEQLRWIKNGWQIKVSSVQFNGIEINTPQDAKRWHQKNSH
jgi:3-deoxy-manno-octulosonate cytidylyltransferase (CMP-KDO synthetase)